ncbi:MAG: HyaD/HybD family hydrogenase maturation endopeptidase [Gammaproteobacteria bacterium]|jgi:hydrogenase maturation protease
MTTQTKTLVLGIGNTLLSDEGAGIHALSLMQSIYAEAAGFTFLDGGTLSFTLATWIEDCHNLIVFDAAELDMPAGAVKTFASADMDAYLGAARRSAHEVGLMDLMDIARLTGCLPANRALIGIQPEYMDWGMEPTESVKQALPEAVEQAVLLLLAWKHQPLNQRAAATQQLSNKTNVESPNTGAER